MAEEYTPVPPAVLQIPDTNKDCISSKEFAKQLRLFQSKITDIVTMLECKDKEDAFSLTFEINYHNNAVHAQIDKGATLNKFVLDCYCNGGD